MYIWRPSNISTPIPIKGVTLSCSFSHLSFVMLLILFVYYFVEWASIDAGPVPSVNNRSSVPNRCTDLSHCRSSWSIVWSCLVTIFSCTWIAVHPNVPCPKKQVANGWIESILNPIMSFAECRLPLFVCALLVPEYVLAWAIRQFLSARKISRENKGEYKTFVIFLPMAIIPTNPLLDRGWSMAHGFFVIMGGFHLFERNSEEINNGDRGISPGDGKPLHPLKANDLQIRKCDGYSESFIMLTEAEIMDKGKSDWLAKSLVLLQTSWFVVQCIARGVKHLPVTHLQIVTLAYAVMNFVIFIFWWKKPRNVHRPIRVFLTREMQLQVSEHVSERISEARGWTWKAVGDVLETILHFMVGFQDEGVNLSREDRVPRFWADSTSGEDLIIANMIVVGVGVCFGAIHCIAWHFSFPTHAELMMWRISSIAITVLPIYIPLMFGLAGLLGGLLGLEKCAIIVFYSAPVIGGILYIIARAVTLVLAFMSLRELLPGAYETIHWTAFIPHV